MKYLLAVLLALLPFVTSQAQDCQNPVTNTAFQIGFNSIAAQTTNQKKLDKALEFSARNCLTSAQVKNIAILFSEDSYRLDFCRSAYQNTFDRVNFFDVFDAFTSFSSALRLYDFTLRPIKNKPFPTERPAETVNSPVSFPAIDYPSPLKYMGQKGCGGPVLEANAFTSLATRIDAQPTDESKLVAIELASQESCLSMAQAMKLSSLLASERLRFRALSELFPRVYDQGNYLFAKPLLPTAALQNEWVDGAELALTPAPPSCQVGEEDVKSIVKSMRAKNFSSEKLDVLRLVKKNRCFSVAQIAMLSKEFSFDKDKVDAMKLLYAECSDQSNYYKLVDEISFGYLQDELNAFIRNGGK